MLAALGTGWSLVPATIVAVKGVPAAQNGLASGVVNTSRLVGGTLGLAVLTTLATSHTNDLLAGGTGQLDALTSGYRIAFLIGAGLCLAGAVAAVTLLRGAAAEARVRPGGLSCAVGSARGPNPRPIPRFIADTSQEGIAGGRFATRLREAFVEAVAGIGDLPAGAAVPEELDWFPERAWGGRVWVPCSARTESDEGTLELFGHVSYELPSGEGDPAGFARHRRLHRRPRRGQRRTGRST